MSQLIAPNNHPSLAATPAETVEIPILLEAQSPLLLGGTLPVDNVISSLGYIAGSTWRGAVANAILDALQLRRRSWQAPAGTLPPDFTQVFDEMQGARFGFLYPVRERGAGSTAAHLTPAPDGASVQTGTWV